MEKRNKTKFISYKDFRKELFKRPGFKKAYDDLGVEFKIREALIKQRVKGFTQKEIAEKLGVTYSALYGFKSGRTELRLRFLQKVTAGLELKLVVK